MLIYIHTLGFVIPVYSPFNCLISQSVILPCPYNKTLLIPFMANNLSSWLQLFKLGVNGIITNYTIYW